MATTFVGPSGTALYRMIALKSALKLQVAGLKYGRGPAATTIARRDYGLTGSALTMIPKIEALIEKAKSELPPGSVY